eukprot:SAG22_NODE_778_length_7279_cov_3.312256_5_plen_117_part_00
MVRLTGHPETLPDRVRVWVCGPPRPAGPRCRAIYAVPLGELLQVSNPSQKRIGVVLGQPIAAEVHPPRAGTGGNRSFQLCEGQGDRLAGSCAKEAALAVGAGIGWPELLPLVIGQW